ncbi:potassium channel family protein [Desulforegula conservatrix]|uniref:potassium channel family protein n=1 Tax=Desulforegula conservatrix TaxID=153026 RepID=UPI00040A3E3C|nr:TrkA family potassium uptake protein [Desulforegula conservatrix]
MKQFGVIGLGNFGYYLAVHLYRSGHEVMAIDKNQSLVQRIKDDVTRAIVADTTDLEAITATGIRDMDAVVVCIGSILGNSILTVLNLQEIGIKRIIAKALSDSHAKILQKIGVSEILFPERDQAISLAEKLHAPNMLDYLPFMEDYSIVQMAPPSSFLGKKLKDLDLINKYGIQVIAIKELIPERVHMIPTGHFMLKDSDIMIILGDNKSLEKMKKL